MSKALCAWTPIHSAADLPKESGDYLVTMCDGPLGAPTARYMRIISYDGTVAEWMDWRSGEWLPVEFAWTGDGWVRVTAWRPLPKPYEGEV